MCLLKQNKMGYTTIFHGRFNLNKPLTTEQAQCLRKFSKTRHEDPTLPGIWCDWTVTEDNHGIEWNGSEKFYEYTAWLKYLIEMYLKPWGYVLDGEVQFEGEDDDDHGCIIVDDNHAMLCKA